MCVCWASGLTSHTRRFAPRPVARRPPAARPVARRPLSLEATSFIYNISILVGRVAVMLAGACYVATLYFSKYNVYDVCGPVASSVG